MKKGKTHKKNHRQKKAARQSDRQPLLDMLEQIYEPDRLPERIEAEYKVVSTLAYSESKSVCLLEGKKDKHKYICKCRSLTRGMRLKAEYECLRTLAEMLSDKREEQNYFPKACLYFQEGSNEYLVREYCEGMTVSDFLDEHGSCSVKEAIDILLPVCEMLSVLHAQNPPLIHRDIKPDNILISEDANGKRSFHIIDLDTVREYKKTGQ